MLTMPMALGACATTGGTGPSFQTLSYRNVHRHLVRGRTTQRQVVAAFGQPQSQDYGRGSTRE